MRSALPFLALLVTACATTGGDNTPPEPAPIGSGFELGPQELAAGECGLFGWDNDTRFTFFATQSRGLYAGSLSRVPGAFALVELVPQGDFPSAAYRVANLDGSEGSRTLDLDLGSAEFMVEGKRYPYAKVKESLPDGFVRVVPLIVIESCQTPGGPS